MKKILPLLYLMALPNLMAIAQWQQCYTRSIADISAMCFLTAKVGYAAGPGKILKTNDGGYFWKEVIKNNTFHHISSVLINDDTVYCFGQHANGQNFRVSFHLEASRYEKSVIDYRPTSPAYLDNSLWFIEDGILKCIRDGSTYAYLQNVQRFKVINGHISATSKRHIHLSADTGKTWATRPMPPVALATAYNEIYYDGSDTLFVSTLHPARLYSSIDEGNTWQMCPPSPASKYHFVDKTNILGIGQPPDTKMLCTSKDGGKTFDRQELARNIKGCYIFSDTVAFLFGDKGIVYRYTGRKQEYDLDLENTVQSGRASIDDVDQALLADALGDRQPDRRRNPFPIIFRLGPGVIPGELHIINSKSEVVEIVSYVRGSSPEWLPPGRYTAKLSTNKGPLIKGFTVPEVIIE